MVDFEPGWLARTLREAHISCMMSHNPAAIAHIVKPELPVSEADAMELYERMNERFKKWTGRDLAAVSRS